MMDGSDPAAPPCLAALEREVHVWTAMPDEIRDAERLALYRSWLSPEERQRHERYLREQDRHLFLVAHALVRDTLSRYADRDPGAWVFEIGSHGRPEIGGRWEGPALRFNLSHSEGLVACLVGLEIEGGVDVENVERDVHLRQLARRVFSARELSDFEAQPESTRRSRFFEYWTLKEAYIKARGLGLDLPLDRFAFELAADGEIAIAFEPPIEDRAEDWQFGLWRLAPDHQLAVALRRGSGPDRTIVRRCASPKPIGH